MRRRCLHSVKSRLEVHGHHFIELVDGQVEYGSRNSAARVVDPHVEAAEGFDSGARESANVVRLRHVDASGNRALGTATLSVDSHALELGLATGGEDEAVAVRREPSRDRGTDAGARASDNYGLGLCHAIQ